MENLGSKLSENFVATAKKRAKIKGDVAIIIRYANRKLYDKDASSYVNLTALKDTIQSGKQIKVLENGTDKKAEKKDITLMTKLQILQEEASKILSEGKVVDFVTEAELDALINRIPKAQSRTQENTANATEVKNEEQVKIPVSAIAINS